MCGVSERFFVCCVLGDMVLRVSLLEGYSDK